MKSAFGQVTQAMSGVSTKTRWFVVLGWMTLIFMLSTDPRSSEHTEKVFKGVWNLLVRKGAHMSEFGLLFLLVRFALTPVQKTNLAGVTPEREMPMAENAAPRDTLGSANRSLIAGAIAVLYACSDEWHQSFVPGRSSTVKDVMVDSTGCLIAWLVCIVVPGLISSKAKSRE